jgi:hypothetical protein
VRGEATPRWRGGLAGAVIAVRPDSRRAASDVVRCAIAPPRLGIPNEIVWYRKTAAVAGITGCDPISIQASLRAWGAARSAKKRRKIARKLTHEAIHSEPPPATRAG